MRRIHVAYHAMLGNSMGMGRVEMVMEYGTAIDRAIIEEWERLIMVTECLDSAVVISWQEYEAATPAAQ